jgi:shikimate dehydrogenase
LVKVATLARKHSDAARLLKLTHANKGRLIAVPMGSVGIPGRVLALRAGSPLTFAVAHKGVSVAPGQLTAKELRGLYRVHKLNARTRVYGVVGSPALHSLSPAMHNAAFAEKKINAVYLPFEVTDLNDFLSCVHDYGLAGFSVTAPHKEKILKHLDSVDPIAAMIGAVNTVVVGKGGKLEGYNTDYVGVLRVLARTVPLECSQVLIVGAGGSARACAFALATAGAFVSVTARRLAASKALARAIGGEAIDRKKLGRREFDVILNCTPVGQQPRDKESPLLKREVNARVVMDLVYRPLETRLLQRGAKTVTGLDMLVEQGAAQFEIWTERRAPVKLMRRAAVRALREA